MVDLNLKLPDSFFLEEERNGYVVSAKMKELWAVQLDLLKEFDRVCRKYNLKYILDFGTLLGAIRHKGFIPWDDDVDVSMLREDYDRLIEIGSQEFSHPYFLQSHASEKNCDSAVAKLRRSDTTFLITENIRHRSRNNQGIFIDIFVFDNIPSNDKKTVDAINQESYEAFLHMYALLHRPGIHDGLKLPFTVLRYLYYKCRYRSSEREYKRLESICRQFDQSDYVANIMYINTECRPRKWFVETTMAVFENMQFPVPEAYDNLLKSCYGDYMTPVQGTADHTVVYYDTSRPYTDFIK